MEFKRDINTPEYVDAQRQESARHTQKNGHTQKNQRLEELRQVALRYLARFSTTEKGLKTVLLRYVKRQRFRQKGLGYEVGENQAGSEDFFAEIHNIVKEMVQKRFVDNGEFARSRLNALQKSGHSLRDIAQRLEFKGIQKEMVQTIIEQEAQETLQEESLLAVSLFADESLIEANEKAAALVLLRKRRLGPFEIEKEGGQDCYENATEQKKNRHKAQIVLARAGFSAKLAQQVCMMDRFEAEERIFRLKNR
ncbi:RecX family transcriptional regulator [Entomobacter blattae]|uniref:Regulatory protein RecX n=1 Tax=Entomobacter blattae TaxID=2762277 RepID=A0A7H1NUR1_9PROT|nr:RecX family transcriptional regulator [Entomobacter blattae]QNT79521.1 Regulatory protein RecX [Entomobacter blattae]